MRETLARFGILSYRLFYFEKNERGEFRAANEYPGAGAGFLHHSRPADARGLLDRRRYSRRGAKPAYWTRRAGAHRWMPALSEKQKMLDALFRQACFGPTFRGKRRPIPN